MTFNTAPRETVARSSYYYDNPYRVYADEPRLREARRLEAARDVIEPETARLERLLMQRFQKGVFIHQGGSVQFIKKVGKFVFVAVTLPPYFAVYMVPKWIMQYGLPFVADIGKAGFNQLSKPFGSVGNWLLHISGSFLERFNQLFRTRLEMAERILRSAKDVMQKAFEKTMRRLMAPFIRLRRILEEETKKRHCQLKTLWDKLKKRTEQALARLIPSFQISFPSLPTFPRLPRLRWPKFSLASFKERGFGYAQNLKKLVWLKKIPRALGLFFWDILLLNYQNWIEPYIQWVVPVCRWLRGHLEAYLEKGRVASAFISTWARKIGDRYKELQHRAQAYLEKVRQAIERGVEVALRPLKALLNKAQRELCRLKSPLLLAFKRGEKTLLFWAATLRVIPQRAFHKFYQLSEGVAHFFIELFRAFQLTYILFKVLFRLAFQYLKSFG